jgi:hypothetical protein
MIVRCDRASHDDALLDVELDHNDQRPDPEWVTITRSYEGEHNAVSDVAMTLDEFRWLVEVAAPKLLAISQQAPAPRS